MNQTPEKTMLDYLTFLKNEKQYSKKERKQIRKAFKNRFIAPSLSS